MDERTYCVYCHKNKINGKRYIGMTKFQDDPNRRWGNGLVYKNSFAKDINKYGWDNFEHIILNRDLTEDEAGFLEAYYISSYDTTNPNYGYNISCGGKGNGGGHPCLDSTKEKIGNANRGRKLTEETKQKISEAGKGHESWCKGKKFKWSHPMSDEQKQKISETHKGKPSWNKGGTVSIEVRQKISNTLTGTHLSEETKEKLSLVSKGCKRMNNGIEEKNVKPENIQYYLDQGYVFGRKQFRHKKET